MGHFPWLWPRTSVITARANYWIKHECVGRYGCLECVQEAEGPNPAVQRSQPERHMERLGIHRIP